MSREQKSSSLKAYSFFCYEHLNAHRHRCACRQAGRITSSVVLLLSCGFNFYKCLLNNFFKNLNVEKKFESRYCETHCKDLCMSMGCGNLIFTNTDLLFQRRATSRLNTNQRFAPRN